MKKLLEFLLKAKGIVDISIGEKDIIIFEADETVNLSQLTYLSQELPKFLKSEVLILQGMKVIGVFRR